MPPYHTVGPNSKCFPTIRRRHTLITLLDPSQGVFSLLDAGASLSHCWARLQVFSCFWTPANAYHTVGPVSRRFPATKRGPKHLKIKVKIDNGWFSCTRINMNCQLRNSRIGENPHMRGPPLTRFR
ncbi:hypothetical protein Y032_0010g1046 [Ancylostoma ceylanicum]|uniref:Uncharacterized protein n=1 Tax=Ancylostoma ceylanicum TaxID=53326 RepID=A0A016VHJ8_9BILA|nr:hypothetical protein Y032_0010g1046 [Ancylostoma ceylanicum]